MSDGSTSSSGSPRVLLVGGRFTGGGAETRLRLLSQHLFGGSCDVAVFEGATDQQAGSGSVHVLGWDGKASYPRITMLLRRILKAGRYDAALSLGLHQNAVLLAASAGLKRRPALIMTEISKPATNNTQVDNGFLRFVRRRLYRLTYRAADLVAANSIDGVNEVVTHYGADPSKTRRIPNIVDPARLKALAAQPVPDWTGQDVPSLCMIARLDRMKRVDTLFEAASGLAPGRAFRIDIVGDGPHRGVWEPLAQQLEIAEWVHFHGWRANPYPYIARARATVLCSEYEGFSNTVLEAMALGVPVITSFCSSDARDMVDRGAALGFPIGDSAALRKCLERVLDGADNAKLAAAARIYAARHHLGASVAEYEALVRDAIDTRAAPKLSGARG